MSNRDEIYFKGDAHSLRFTFSVGALLILTSTALSANDVVLASQSKDMSSGLFLHGVSEDIINDYNDLNSNHLSDVDNYSEVNITNAYDSLVIVSQQSIGNLGGNKAKVEQTGNANTAIVGQKGGRNTAYIKQTGDNNAAAIGQLGLNNESLVVQDGDNNLAVVGQANVFHSSSKLSVNQVNDNNIAFVAGSGGADLGISQGGRDMVIISDASKSMRIYVDQSR